jgi:hypothetical protein
MASSVSMRSRTVSPMPMSSPDVNGMRSSPASRVMRRRLSGRLSGALWCGMPFSHRRGLTFSSMSPSETFTRASRCISSRDRMPALVCGRSPYSSASAPAHSR